MKYLESFFFCWSLVISERYYSNYLYIFYYTYKDDYIIYERTNTYRF